MRARALIHVAGPAGAGKTAFVERLLAAEDALTICVRGERDPKLRAPRSTAAKTDAELRRYRQAGAGAVARYRFAEPDPDAFFTSDVMQDYSEAVVIEGDCPTDFVDLTVFVASPPVTGRALLRRVVGGRAARHDPPLERFARALDSPAAPLELLGAELGPEVVAGLKRLRVLDDVRKEMAAQLGRARRAQPPAPAERWALDDDYAGLERAELVVVNLRPDGDRLVRPPRCVRRARPCRRRRRGRVERAGRPRLCNGESGRLCRSPRSPYGRPRGRPHRAAARGRGRVQGARPVGRCPRGNADTVADAVVAGRSAEPLLDGAAGSGAAGAVQRDETKPGQVTGSDRDRREDRRRQQGHHGSDRGTAAPDHEALRGA